MKEGKPTPQNKKRNKKDYEASDDEETFCLVCTEPYSNSRAREKWVQCTACHMWAHEACTDAVAVTSATNVTTMTALSVQTCFTLVGISSVVSIVLT